MFTCENIRSPELGRSHTLAAITIIWLIYKVWYTSWYLAFFLGWWVSEASLILTVVVLLFWQQWKHLFADFQCCCTISSLLPCHIHLICKISVNWSLFEKICFPVCSAPLAFIQVFNYFFICEKYYSLHLCICQLPLL